MAARIRAALLGLLIAGATLLLAVPAQAAPRSVSTAALSWAEHHAKGVPYVWGGAGPWGYDCSGLVMAAYGHAGVGLPHYTVAMVQSGKMYQVRYPRPGDLAFWGPSWAPYHVELYVKPGWTFGAQNSGTVVGFHPMRWFHPDSYWRIR